MKTLNIPGFTATLSLNHKKATIIPALRINIPCEFLEGGCGFWGGSGTGGGGGSGSGGGSGGGNNGPFDDPSYNDYYFSDLRRRCLFGDEASCNTLRKYGKPVPSRG